VLAAAPAPVRELLVQRARAVLQGRKGSCNPTPAPANPSKPLAVGCVALENQYSWGNPQFSILVCACLPHWTKERCDRLARGARIMHPIIAAGNWWLGKTLHRQENFTIAVRE
jgi:hypothetical protein